MCVLSINLTFCTDLKTLTYSILAKNYTCSVPGEPTRKNWPIRFISSQQSVSLRNIILFHSLAKEMKNRISQVLRISKRSLAEILPSFFARLSILIP